MKRIKNALLREIGKEQRPDVFNQQNQNLMERYWRVEYEESDRDVKDPASAKGKLQRTIFAMGNVSLVSANKAEIIKQFESNRFPRNKERELTDKLNALLKFAGRDVRIRKKQEERPKVKHLNEKDMLKVAKYVNQTDSNEDQALEAMIMLAFYSGLRLGELYALTKQSLKGKGLEVISQIDKDDIERDPKWGSARMAFLFPQGTPYFKKWTELKDSIEISRSLVSKRFNRACRKIFSDDKSKWCKFHDTRHSYAIHLLQHDVSLSLISQSLGNSIVVCQKYYAGFSLTNETIETVSRKVQGNK